MIFSPKKAVQDFIFEDLSRRQLGQTEREALLELHPKDLLCVYLTWRMRNVPARPREIHVSKQLKRKLEDTNASRNMLEGYRKLSSAISSGKDISSFLSTRARRVYHSPMKVNGERREHIYRQDLDMMLFDFGIHHLHLSRFIDPKYSQPTGERTTQLLFAIFRKERVFLIDLGSHDDWSKQFLLRIVVHNWKEFDLLNEITAITGIRKFSDREISYARRNAINSAVCLDGKSYWAGDGLTAAGTSTAAQIDSDRIMFRLNEFTGQFGQIISDARNRHYPLPPGPVFKFYIDQDGSFGVFEPTTGYRRGMGKATVCKA